MSTVSSRQQFEAFLEDMIAGRYDDVSGLLAPDVVWHLPPFVGIPPFEGHEAVMKFMRETPAAIYQPGSMRIEIHAATFDPPHASCLSTLRATTRHGQPYENQYMFFARLRDGLLEEVWELLDTAVFERLTRPPE
jgi:ketosteroid isomerase-like protein